MEIRIKAVLRFLLLLFTGAVLLLVIISILVFFNKEKIVSYSKELLHENIHKGIKVDDIRISLFERPGSVSVIVMNPSLADTVTGPYTPLPVFKAEQISLHFNLWKLICFIPRLESVSFENARIQLLKNASGRTNFSFLDKKKKKQPETGQNSHIKVPIDKILFHNVFFSFVDSLNNKSFEIDFVRTQISLNETDSLIQVALKGNIHFGGLSFNTQKGSFVNNADTRADINCVFDSKAMKLSVLPSSITIAESKYGLEGYFLFGKPLDIRLQISADEAYMARVLPNLPGNVSAILNNYKLSGPIKASLLLSGKLEPGYDPCIDLKFTTENNSLIYPGIYTTLTGLSFSGTLTNHFNKDLHNGDANSMVNISDIGGTIGKGYLKANLVINRFVDTDVAIKTTLNAGLADLGKAFPFIPLHGYDGNIEVDAAFSGMVPKASTKPDQLNWHYSGLVHLKNAGFDYNKLSFKNISGSVRVSDNLVYIDTLGVLLSGNKVDITGKFLHPLEHFVFPESPLKASLMLHAMNFNMEVFLTDNPGKRKQKRKVTSVNGLKQVHQALDHIDFSIGLNIEKIKYRRMLVQNLLGNIQYSGDQLKMNKLVMNTAGGELLVDGNINGMERGRKKLNVKVDIQDLDIQKLFYSLENFKQELITDANVRGRINMGVVFDSPVTDNYDIVASEMKGKLKFSLKNGKLLNFAPFESLSKFIFKKRHLENVEFSEINADLALSGEEISVAKMKIHSTAFTLYVDGIYSMKDVMDLHLQIPLSNLKNRENFLKEMEQNPDMETGSSIRLHAHRKNGKVKLGYDFARFFGRHKEKKLAESDSVKQ